MSMANYKNLYKLQMYMYGALQRYTSPSWLSGPRTDVHVPADTPPHPPTLSHRPWIFEPLLIYNIYKDL